MIARLGGAFATPGVLVTGARVLILLNFFIFSSAYSQGLTNKEDGFFEEINKDVTQLIDRHLQYVSLSNQQSKNQGKEKGLYSYSPTDSLTIINALLNDTERRMISKDIGLRFTLGYVENFANGFGDLGFFYRRAAQTGLDWNLLNDGYLESRLKSKEFYYQQQIKTLLNNKTIGSEEQSLLYNRIVEIFIEAKKLELEKRQSFVREYLGISKKLYYKKLLLWDDILKIIAQQKEVEELSQQLIYLSSSIDSNYNSSYTNYLPVLRLNKDLLLTKFNEFRNQDSLQKYHQEYLKYKYKAINDFNLKPYLRYNYYDYNGLSLLKRDFLSAGVQFSMPLPLRARQNAQYREYKNLEFINQNSQDLKNSFNELRGWIFDYQSKYNNYVEFFYKKLIIEERISREQKKLDLKDPAYSPVSIARQLNEWYQVNKELIDIKEDLYLILLKIRSQVPEASISDFTEEVDLVKEAAGQKFQTLSMYIWSTTFKELSNEEILQEVKAANCKSIILSINQDDFLKLKAYELISLISKEKIDLHLMIGNNSFIYPSNKEEFINAIAYLTEIPGIKGIHLDIEPQAMPELKPKREVYQEMYVNMLAVAKEAMKKNGLQLSVSIPLFYEKEKLKKIYLYADKVYLMTYENIGLEHIKKGVEDELSIDKDKTVIALRTKDFKDNNAMSLFIKVLTSMFDISEYGIHDLKSWKK